MFAIESLLLRLVRARILSRSPMRSYRRRHLEPDAEIGLNRRIVVLILEWVAFERSLPGSLLARQLAQFAVGDNTSLSLTVGASKEASYRLPTSCMHGRY